MKDPVRTRHPLAMAAILWLALAGLSKGQVPTPAPTPVDPLAGVPVQVLDQQQVTIGTHTITFNRVAPPPLPGPTPSASPAAQTQAVTPGKTPRTSGSKPSTRVTRAKKTSRSATVNSAEGSDEPKPYKVLSVSATVYDHRFTELRWYGGGTTGLRVYVNLDGNLLAGTTNLETADATYQLMIGLGNEGVDALTQAGLQPPDLSRFPANQVAYQLIEGEPAAAPEAMAELAALCAYYDANKAQLALSYQQRLADDATRAQWLQDHPPQQPDTVINYWPARNSVFLGQPGQ